jgi:predicted GNAT family acetyltransferase
MADPSVTVNDQLLRFEHAADGEVAFLDYKLEGDRLTLVHTEVPEALEGRGLGGVLVKAALSYAQENDLTVIPVCSFVRSYLKRHPEAANGVRLAEVEHG